MKQKWSNPIVEKELPIKYNNIGVMFDLMGMEKTDVKAANFIIL